MITKGDCRQPVLRFAFRLALLTGLAVYPASAAPVPAAPLELSVYATAGDVAGFFVENASVFEDLIVDDLYCTADTSPDSRRARGDRPWSVYRRDLLVSLIDPVIVQPTRRQRPDARLILKYPQWYDRFHLFGYAPARMSPPFDMIWVGTTVRNPITRRMGFVQPAEGYVNFRWLASIAGAKVRGAWFDHVERGATLVLTPALVRALGQAGADLAGVEVAVPSQPPSASAVRPGGEWVSLAVPLGIDGGQRAPGHEVRIQARRPAREAPLPTERAAGRGRALVLNVRTFNEQDLRDTGEWLLAPKELGFAGMPERLANELRTALLAPPGVELRAPAGMALHLFEQAACVCNFGDRTNHVRLNGGEFPVPPHQSVWRELHPTGAAANEAHSTAWAARGSAGHSHLR